MAKALGTIERLWYFTVEGDDEAVFGWEIPEFEHHLHTPIGEWAGDEAYNPDKEEVLTPEAMAEISRIEGTLNQMQAHLVCDEGLSVEESLTATAVTVPKLEEPWDGVAR